MGLKTVVRPIACGIIPSSSMLLASNGSPQHLPRSVDSVHAGMNVYA